MKRKLSKFREPIFLGPLLTLGVIVLTELLNVGALGLPTPILLLLPVAYVAFAGGLGTGLLCASIAALYALHFYSEPEAFLTYTQDDFLRLVGFSFTVLATAAMVGTLRNTAGRSEARVRTSEARLRSMMEMVPLGIAVISYREGGKVEELNQNLWKTFGYDSAEEFQAVPLVELYDEPSDRDRVLALQSQDSLTEHVVRFRRKDGSTFWSAISSVWHTSADGEKKTVFVLRDLTDIRQAEAARREYEALNAATVEAALDSILTIDGRGTILEFNPAAEATFGYTREYAVGREMGELIVPPSMRPAHRQGLHRQVTTGESRILDQQLELTAMRADGSEFPAELAITRIAHDGPPRFTGYVRDITRRKEAEDRLRSSEERFRLLIEGVKDYGIFMLDPEGNIASWNQGAERLKGYTQDEALGQHLSIFYTEDDRRRGAPDRHLEIAVAAGRVENEGWRVRKDGSMFWANANLTALRDEQGNLRGFSKVTHDITERKNAEEQLRQRAEELARTNGELASRNEENEMFVYSVSHDLRSPLVNLEGFSQELSMVSGELRSLIAESDLPPGTRARGLELVDEEMGESLYFIRNGVGRLSNIIDALLRLSRAGRVEYSWQSVDVDSMVASVVDSMRETIEERGASVEVGQLPAAWGDPAALEQVFANLIGNAFKYLEPDRPGLVEISGKTEPESGTVLYRIVDNGLGMPEHAKSKVFQVFQRMHPETTEGEGVGLSLVRRTVERHGGSVWADSVQGEGSTFFVRLRTAPEES